MKTLAIGYMVSLLFGLPHGQVTPIQQNDAPSSLPSELTGLDELRLRDGGAGQTEAVESMVVEYRSQGATDSLALLGEITKSADQSDLKSMVAKAPDALTALKRMQEAPALADYTDWLNARLDDMAVAAEAGASEAGGETSVIFRPLPPVVAVSQPGQAIPLYEPWLAWMKDRPEPSRAGEFLPMIRAAFAAEGLPDALVWLAEAESTFNPRARNPVGALGLFQLMPETARSLGLSLRPRDQRLHPATNARAAAKYLKRLHERFGDWPLALAAYNSGEARVARLLRVRGAKDFAGIANHLPAETQLYVPKVLATIEVRTGVSLAELPTPQS